MARSLGLDQPTTVIHALGSGGTSAGFILGTVSTT